MVAQRSEGRAVSATATQAATWFSRWRSAFTGGTKRLFHKITITVPSALVAVTLVAISCTALWIEKPIVVNAFTVEASSGTAGLAADALADRLKARISQINADSGNLFQVRKLSDSNLPLDVKVGGTGLSVAAIAKALGIRFTTAEIAGHVAQIGNKLTLQFTVSQGVPVRVESPTPIDLPVPGTQGAEENFVKAVDLALDCFATKVMIMISPDVAANYLHTLERGSDLDIAYLYARQPPDCVHDDDVDLYSEVRKNPEAPPATQINALVGLSVHYGEMGEFYEEVNMAKAATDLASRLVPCEDSPGLSVWQRVKCTMLWKRSDTNRRAYIAAWMQLGAAYSDHASAAPNPMEVQRRRLLSMDAYRHLLRSTPKYALASDGLGIQQALLLDETGAVKTYDASLQEGESDAAHMDRGLTLIHGRRDSYVRLSLAREVLDAAEVEFRAAIRMNPNYWDAHARLGYVLFEQGRFRESAEVLEVALAHDRSNRPLRRLLGSVLADSCQFDAAKSIFNEAYQTDVALESVASAKINAPPPKAIIASIASADPKTPVTAAGLDTLVDWGKVLDGFGFYGAALEQETAVIRQDPKDIEAYIFRGQIAIKHRAVNAADGQQGLTDLSIALALDAARSPSVVEAYLAGLVQTGQAAAAVALYERWANEGLVPLPIAAAPNEILHLPPNQRLRVTYAQALLQSHQDGTREQQALALIHMRSDVEIPDILAQGRGIVADEEIMEGIPGPNIACRTPLVSYAPHLQDVAITAK